MTNQGCFGGPERIAIFEPSGQALRLDHLQDPRWHSGAVFRGGRVRQGPRGIPAGLLDVSVN